VGLDDYLERVLIGPPESGPVTLAEYDESWTERFEEHRRRIAGAIGGAARGIEHIGSTAVPGLAAKPVIDVLVTVADPDDEDAYLPALLAAGYELRVREPGHRMVRPPTHDANVHVWAAGSEDVRRYLAFRDRLRTSPEDRARYEAVKRSLAGRDWPSRDHYAQAKSDVVAEILSRAAGTSG
jgi:GrpB-like predicted nucleotidyltransferase (UPF0157 family)